MNDSSFPPPITTLPPPPPDLKKHSSIGIVAFVMGILDILGVCLMFGLSLYSQDAPANTSDTLTSVVGFMAICLVIVSIVGVVLGIIGVVQKAQSKVFAIIGLVLNALVLLGICVIMAIGMAALGSLGL